MAYKNKQCSDQLWEKHRFSKTSLSEGRSKQESWAAGAQSRHIKTADARVCLPNYDGLVNMEGTDVRRTSKEQRYILQGTPVESSFDNTCLKEHQKDGRVDTYQDTTHEERRIIWNRAEPNGTGTQIGLRQKNFRSAALDVINGVIYRWLF